MLSGTPNPFEENSTLILIKSIGLHVSNLCIGCMYQYAVKYAQHNYCAISMLMLSNMMISKLLLVAYVQL